MDKIKNVTIPQALLNALAVYITTDPDPHDPDLYRYCWTGLQQKLDAMIKHDLYTRYKTAPTEKQKEAARRDYLDRAGIPQDFRW